MNNFSGINNFGSLTTQSGQRLRFKDFDIDGDGKISSDEYSRVSEKYGLDTVELSTVDENKDKSISEDEFAVWEQKTLMEDAVNRYKGQLSSIFYGDKSASINNILSDLKSYIDEFANNFDGNVQNMAIYFQDSLPTRFNRLVSLEQASYKDSGELIDSMLQRVSGLDAESYQILGELLEKRVESFFAQDLSSNDFDGSLERYLNDFIKKSEAERLQDDYNDYTKSYKKLGRYVDSDDMQELKKAAEEFLKSAFNECANLQFAGKHITNVNQISSLIEAFESPVELNDAINEVKESFSNSNLVQRLKEREILIEEAEKEEAENEALANLEGSDIVVENKLQFNGNIRSFTVASALSDARQHLEGIFRTNIRGQITSQLSQLGISFSSIEGLFGSVYEQTINDTLSNTVGLLDVNYYSFYKCQINLNNLGQAFVANFNENFAQAINEMNGNGNAVNTTGEAQLNQGTITVIENPLEEAIKSMNLRETYCPGVYCEKETGFNSGRLIHYVWDKNDQKMVELKGVYHIGSDGTVNHRSKYSIDVNLQDEVQSYVQGYNFTNYDGIYEKDGEFFKFNKYNKRFEKVNVDDINNQNDKSWYYDSQNSSYNLEAYKNELMESILSIRSKCFVNAVKIYGIDALESQVFTAAFNSTMNMMLSNISDTTISIEDMTNMFAAKLFTKLENKLSD